MRRIFSILIATLVLGRLWAQDDDIFADGAFDAAVDAGQTAAAANQLEWLGGVSLASTTNLVLPNDATTYGSVSQFTGRGFLKATRPQVGALFLSYSYAHTLWASTNDDTLATGYEQADWDPAAPTYTLNEFHLSFDLGKVVFLRLGSQLLDWGASAVWSPADFVNRRSADPNAPLDTRAGKPGLRVHVPWNGGNLFVFADASQSFTTEGTPRDLITTGALAAKIDTVVAGWNLGLVGNASHASGPRVGLTASGALWGVDLWAEAGALVPTDQRDLSWSASLGGEQSWGLDGEWTFRAEGFFNPDGHEGAITADLRGDFVPYYWGRAYMYAELLRAKLLDPNVTGSVSATANLTDASWQGVASLRTTFPGLIPLSAFVQYNGGDAQREFTLATGGPAWTLGIRSLVEF